MATTPNMHRRISDRPLYILAAGLIPLVVLAGFARTYYLKGFFATPPLPNMIVQIHGVVMTAWVVLFIVQVTLVGKRRTKLHKQLGILGAGLAVLVLIVAIIPVVYGGACFVNDPSLLPAGAPPPLPFLIIPLGDMLVFAILISAALYYRKKRRHHAT